MRVEHRKNLVQVCITDLELLGLGASDPNDEHRHLRMNSDGLEIRLDVKNRPSSGNEPIISYDGSILQIDVSKEYYDRHMADAWMHKSECTPWEDESIRFDIDLNKYYQPTEQSR